MTAPILSPAIQTKLEALVTRFPTTQHDAAGNLIPFKASEIRQGAAAWKASQKLQAVAVEVMFPMADFIAALAAQSTDTRKFNQLLTKYEIDVSTNDRAAMTQWWGDLSKTKRDEAVAYARTNGIVTMTTLRRHIQRNEEARMAPVLDMNLPRALERDPRREVTLQAIQEGTPTQDDPRYRPMQKLGRPKAKPVDDFRSDTLTGATLPEGVHPGDIHEVLDLLATALEPERLAFALAQFLEVNPTIRKRMRAAYFAD